MVVSTRGVFFGAISVLFLVLAKGDLVLVIHVEKFALFVAELAVALDPKSANFLFNF